MYFRLRQVNNVLTFVVVAMALYILFAPFVPAAMQFWNKQKGFRPPAYVTQFDGSDPIAPPPVNADFLVIPSIGLETEILQGATAETVDKGAWLRPQSVQPGQLGNAVIVGHRYSYNVGIAHPFYSLDDVSVGDQIYVTWKGQLQTYAVKEKKIVPPTATNIEAQTPDTTLTLYTCTPLWTSKNRLVVVAVPHSGEPS